MKKKLLFILLITLIALPIFASADEQYEYMVVSFGKAQFSSMRSKTMAYWDEGISKETLSAESYEKNLDILGANGWQVVSITGVIGGDQQVILKRDLDIKRSEAELKTIDENSKKVIDGWLEKLLAEDNKANEEEKPKLIELDSYEKQVALDSRVLVKADGEGKVVYVDANRIDIRGEVIAKADVEIDANCIFEGLVTLGENVTVGANCILKNVMVADGTVIHPFSHLEECSVGQNCIIGPYARLRPGTELGDEAKIGNFVETKKAIIGEGSKVNHLSYIGDTDMGKNVNIGAGTITCNYDGVNKHKTIIGDRVFVGSDSQLVAPVQIGDDATIGAGSTITKDVPEAQLTLSRSKQLTIPSWQKPIKK